MLNPAHSYFDPIQEAIDSIRAGGQVIVVDDENRENEGDLIMAACHATPQSINQMIVNARGLICAPAQAACLQRLDLPDMVPGLSQTSETAFTVSVDAREGVATGISAQDRAHTLRLLASPYSVPADFVAPGHIFPLRAKEGGVLERPGHTEATVDLVRLAGCYPVGVLCEILNEDGSMARLPDLVAFKQRFHLKMVSIADLISYRQAQPTPALDWALA